MDAGVEDNKTNRERTVRPANFVTRYRAKDTYNQEEKGETIHESGRYGRKRNKKEI